MRRSEAIVAELDRDDVAEQAADKIARMVDLPGRGVGERASHPEANLGAQRLRGHPRQLRFEDFGGFSRPAQVVQAPAHDHPDGVDQVGGADDRRVGVGVLAGEQDTRLVQGAHAGVVVTCERVALCFPLCGQAADPRRHLAVLRLPGQSDVCTASSR